MHRPPNSGDDFWQLFQDSMDKVMESNVTKVVIIGDLNADPSSADGSNLSMFCNLNNLQSLVNQPTRITENSATSLDQILTNIDHFIKRVNVEPPLSSCDHCIISSDFLFRLQK